MTSLLVTGIVFVFTFIVSVCKIAKKEVPAIDTSKNKAESLHTVHSS
ncbi:MAG TPA: hypothetical protein PLA74_09960 [Syntrophales bacterium]|nr:hypothetical protein [Syntrophales bacterium]HPQ45204.1 hypothetical protein [Syntrophales bacterium]